MRTLVLLSTAALLGCRKPPPAQNHYYSLVLEATNGQAISDRPAPEGRVDLKAVTLPDYLLTRSLVMQVNSNEVRPAKYHHWGEPIDTSVRKVLVRDLSTALPTLDIIAGHRQSADCTLIVEFDRFHATNDAKVLASGRYTIHQGDRTVRQEFDVTQVQHGDGYTNAVKGMRRAVRALGDQLQPALQGCVSAPGE